MTVLDPDRQGVRIIRDAHWYSNEAARLRQKGLAAKDDQALCNSYLVLATEYERLAQLLERKQSPVF